MKHCKSCKNCSKDLVAQYFKGIDLYKCEVDRRIIFEPFWEKCDRYEKDDFNVSGFGKWFSDCFKRPC